MKNYEDMARDVLQRIDAYEAVQRMKRTKIIKAAISFAPVCAAAVIGVGLWKSGILSANHDHLISSTTDASNSEVMLSAENVTSADKHSAIAKNITDKNGESSASAVAANIQAEDSDAAVSPVTENSNANNDPVEENTPDNTVNKNDLPQKTTETAAIHNETPVQQTAPVNNMQNGHSYILTGDEEPPEQLTLITSYPSGENSMAVPALGNYGCSHSLYMAMEEYKDTANYLVIADIFSKDGQIFNYDELAAEAKRLYDNGYTAAVETVNAQGDAYSYISLNATYEQLQHFVVRPDYAYAFRLYNN